MSFCILKVGMQLDLPGIAPDAEPT